MLSSLISTRTTFLTTDMLLSGQGTQVRLPPSLLEQPPPLLSSCSTTRSSFPPSKKQESLHSPCWHYTPSRATLIEQLWENLCLNLVASVLGSLRLLFCVHYVPPLFAFHTTDDTWLFPCLKPKCQDECLLVWLTFSVDVCTPPGTQPRPNRAALPTREGISRPWPLHYYWELCEPTPPIKMDKTCPFRQRTYLIWAAEPPHIKSLCGLHLCLTYYILLHQH